MTTGAVSKISQKAENFENFDLFGNPSRRASQVFESATWSLWVVL